MRVLGRIVFHLFAVAVVAYLTLPMVCVILMSFTPSRFLELPSTDFSLRWYKAFFGDTKWLDGLSNSLIVGTLTVLISLLVGTTAALTFTRHKFRLATTIYTLALTPLFTPAIIIAMALLAFANVMGLSGSYLIVAIGHALWSFPLVIMVLKVSLDGLDPSLEEAAGGMGASGWQTFLSVVLPLSGPSILVGALFAFIISVNEFVMALFLGTSQNETLPRIIYPILRYRLTPVVAAASSVLTLLTVFVLLLSARIMNLRRLVELGRGH